MTRFSTGAKVCFGVMLAGAALVLLSLAIGPLLPDGAGGGLLCPGLLIILGGALGLPFVAKAQQIQASAESRAEWGAALRGIARVHGLEGLPNQQMRLDLTLEMPGYAPHRGFYRGLVVRQDRRHLEVGAERPAVLSRGVVRVHVKAAPDDAQLREPSIFLHQDP